VESTRCERDLAGLIDKGLQNLGVAVALVAGTNAADSVDVLAAFDIPHVDSLAALENGRLRLVSFAEIGVLEVHVSLWSHSTEASCGHRSKLRASLKRLEKHHIK